MGFKILTFCFLFSISLASADLFEYDLYDELYYPEPLRDEKASAFCTACTIGVNQILNAEDPALVLNKTIELCIDLGIGNDFFCESFITMNGPEINYINQHAPNESGKDICGILFGGMGCETDNPDRIWQVPLPNVPKPPVNEPPLAGPEMPTMKVLHLSDTHFDPDYYPGADTTNCPEKYLCCRESNGIPIDPQDGAGFWGDYRKCDTPRWTLEALYAQISAQHPDIDFILWTGDLVPHDVWNTSRESNLLVINSMADMIYEYFPDIPVFPAVGNHEAHPMNLFPQPYVTEPEFEISWLYDELTRIWQRWLPSDVATSIAYGAYYNTLIRPGLRVMSVNTQYCYGYNFWLILDSTDIAQELELLAEGLQDAENNGESVYIIGHIPSGNNDCSLTWSHEFNRVTSRYENTITGIFYGHTHFDHYQLFFDPSNFSRVYEIGYIAQSQTTYSYINPGYKVYTIEGDFENSKFRVLDHENWILDLNTTNYLNQTVFTKLYSAKEFYGLSDLSPESLLDLVFRMNATESLFDGFYRNLVKAGSSYYDGCDEKCKSDNLCRLLISDNSDHSHCDWLLPQNNTL